MKRAALLLLLCAGMAAPDAALARRHAVRIDRPPVVVELFTAQGCSSCGQANALMGQLAERPGVVALTWPVDYWDYLGWKDTFAQPQFTERQRAYDRRFGLRDVYTPQLIVSGAAQASGAKPEAVEKLLREAGRAPTDPPEMTWRNGGRVAVGSGKRLRGGAEVWLVRYDPRSQDIEVKDGDNKGKTVVQRNVVRQLVPLGVWTGRAAVYKLPTPSEDGLVTLVLLQGAKGGRVITALKKDAPKP
jgi:hypothetical protein